MRYVLMALAGLLIGAAAQAETTPEQAMDAIRARRSDPAATEFRNVRAIPGGPVCGSVSVERPRSGHGSHDDAFTTFVVDRDSGFLYVHARTPHIEDDIAIVAMWIRAFCERAPGETIREAQRREAAALIASFEAARRAMCARERRQPPYCAPQAIAQAVSERQDHLRRLSLPAD